MRVIITRLLILSVIILQNCVPIIRKSETLEKKDTPTTYKNSLSENGCIYPEQQKYKKEQVYELPKQGILRAEREGYLLNFKWSKLKIGSDKKLFKKGKILIISLQTEQQGFGSIRDHTKYYTDFMTNLPCPYKQHTYATDLPRDEFNYLLKKHCHFTDDKLKEENPYKIKLSTELFSYEQKTRFSVGSRCPEKIIPEKEYFILYRFHPSEHTHTYIQLYSELLEKVFVKKKTFDSHKTENDKNPVFYKTDCPYLLGKLTIQKNFRQLLCVYSQKKVWIEKLCIPIRNHNFNPGENLDMMEPPMSPCIQSKLLSKY